MVLFDGMELTCNTIFVMYKETKLLTVNGKALTSARIASKLSLLNVAEKLNGCNQSSVSRWEQEKLIPSLARIVALVDLYGTNKFVRLNETAVLTDFEVEELKKLRKELLYGRFYLNGKAVLTEAEIEVVMKLREG